MMRCPCCMSPVASNFVWSPETHTFAVGNDSQHFTLQMSNVFNMLLSQSREGKAARKSDLINALYEDRADGGALSAELVLRSIVYRLRKAIKPHGLDIQCIWGHAYALTIQEKRAHLA